jgi:hypothetical protein
MSEPMLRLHVDLKAIRFEIAMRTVHVVAGCLGAAAIVAAAKLPVRAPRELPPTRSSRPELEPGANELSDRRS